MYADKGDFCLTHNTAKCNIKWFYWQNMRTYAILNYEKDKLMKTMLLLWIDNLMIRLICSRTQCFLQYMCICRFYSLIVMFLSFDNLKSKFLIKINCAFVTYLNMPANIKQVLIKRCPLVKLYMHWDKNKCIYRKIESKLPSLLT